MSCWTTTSKGRSAPYRPSRPLHPGRGRGGGRARRRADRAAAGGPLAAGPAAGRSRRPDQVRDARDATRLRGRLLDEAGENGDVTAALAEYAAEVAEQASVGLYTRTGEAASLRQLDAEDVTLRHALDWAMEHDPDTAVRLALSQAPLWNIRGRLVSQAPVLAAAAEHAEAGSGEWCGARMLLAQAATYASDPVAALEHYDTVRNVLEDQARPASWEGPVLLSLCLDGRSAALLQLGRVAEAVDDASRALAVARQASSQGLEAAALACLGVAAWQVGDRDGALRIVREAQGIPDEFAGGLYRALSSFIAMILTEVGDLDGAEQACAAGLASCRDVGDLANLSSQLWNQAILDLRPAASATRRHTCASSSRSPCRPGCAGTLMTGLDCCGQLSRLPGARPRRSRRGRRCPRSTAPGRYRTSPGIRPSGKNSCGTPGNSSGRPGHGRRRNVAPP